MVDDVGEHGSETKRALIRDILLREWDPIRVREIGAPEREYDMYVDPIFDLLANRHPSQEELAAYLLDIQTRRMGLCDTPTARERCHRAAISLLAAAQDL